MNVLYLQNMSEIEMFGNKTDKLLFSYIFHNV